MTRFAKKGLLAAVLALCAGPVLAENGYIDFVITPVSPQVTYSTLGKTTKSGTVLNGQLTKFAYTVKITNVGTNTVNDIVFQGTVSSTVLPNEVATFVPADSGSVTPCTGTDTPNKVLCSISTLRAGESVGPFVLFFSAPVLPNPVPTNDALSFSGPLTYSGQDVGNTTPTSTFAASATTVALGTQSAINVKSAVAKASGGTYFTGDAGFAGFTTSTTPFTTTIVVPSGFMAPNDTYTTAEISILPKVTPNTENCVNFTAGCQKAQVTIPSTTFAVDASGNPNGTTPLTILLRLDASYVPKTLNIANVTLYYYTDSVDPAQSIQYPILGCVLTPPVSTIPGVPCLTKPVSYVKKTQDLDGYYEWTLINTKNGGYSVD